MTAPLFESLAASLRQLRVAHDEARRCHREDICQLVREAQLKLGIAVETLHHSQLQELRQ